MTFRSSTAAPQRAATTQRIDVARELLLTPFGLDESHLARALADEVAAGLDMPVNLVGWSMGVSEAEVQGFFKAVTRAASAAGTAGAKKAVLYALIALAAAWLRARGEPVPDVDPAHMMHAAHPMAHDNRAAGGSKGGNVLN